MLVSFSYGYCFILPLWGELAAFICGTQSEGWASLLQVSKPGSVKVERLMEIERYSHVMHISSTVKVFTCQLNAISLIID